MLSRTSEKLRKRENWLDLPKIRSLRSSLRIQPGFTIIELLVTISIVAILMSIMMPGFRAARESANRIQCSSNLRQIGLAIYLYAFQNGEHLPETIFDNDGNAKQSEMMALTTGSMSDSPSSGQWDGLGLLIGDGNNFLDNPHCLFCPCHHGNHDFQQLNADSKSSPTRIYSNYHFIGDTDNSSHQPRYICSQTSENPLVVDGMREELDINHLCGTNTLRGDGSVRFWSDHALLLRNIMSSVTVDNPPSESAYNELWKSFAK
ncbi:MAG: type II secretion system protein [Planctomycetota bacterium]|nr:type II secretion system protein [Planctomycetota bacterium]